MSQPAIALSGVYKRYGAHVALAGLDLRVARGELWGLVGDNGAGKTTALRIAAGYIDPDLGQVLVAGHDVARERRRAQALVGYLPESAPLPGDMRVEGYLRFRARLKGVSRRAARGRVERVCERCGLHDHRRRPIGQLSKGYRQRVGLADALIADPPVLLLDEPSSGLDPTQIRGLRALLRELAGERAIVVSSHALAEVEQVCDRVAVLAGGRAVGAGSLAALRELAELPDGSLEQIYDRLRANQPIVRDSDTSEAAP